MTIPNWSMLPGLINIIASSDTTNADGYRL